MPLRRNHPCRHLDCRLPASRAVRKFVSVVEAAQSVILCNGGTDNTGVYITTYCFGSIRTLKLTNNGIKADIINMLQELRTNTFETNGKIKVSKEKWNLQKRTKWKS